MVSATSGKDAVTPAAPRIHQFLALSNNWRSSPPSQGGNSGSSPDGAIFAAMLKLVARTACQAGVLRASSTLAGCDNILP